MRIMDDGSVVMKVGHVPDALRKQSFELALVVLKNKYFCFYNSFYNLRSYRWDLLDMGLYLDSLTYHDPSDTAVNVLRSDKVSGPRRMKIFVQRLEKWSVPKVVYGCNGSLLSQHAHGCHIGHATTTGWRPRAALSWEAGSSALSTA
jgi:hypothetical protein